MRVWHWNLYGVQLMVVVSYQFGIGVTCAACPHCWAATVGLILGPISILLSSADHDLRHIIWRQ